MVEKKYEIKKAFSCSDEMCSLTQELSKKRIGPEIKNSNQITKKASKTIIETKQENLKLKSSSINKNNRKKITCIAEDTEILDIFSEIEKMCDNIVLIPPSKLNNSQGINEYESFTSNIWGDYYGVIYKLEDTNKDGYWDRKMKYLGQTIQSLGDRFLQQLREPNFLLKKALDRYHKDFKIVKIDSEHYQTKGGEFTIEVIKKALNLQELNNLEIAAIKEYKTQFSKYFKIDQFGNAIPLYGFNISKGGEGRPHISGITHPSFKVIDKEELERLIKMGAVMTEISKELGVGENLIKDRLKLFFHYDNIMEAREKFGVLKIFRERRRKYYQKQSERYRENMQLDKFISLIEKGYMLHELMEELSISLKTVYTWLNILGYDNLGQAYSDLGSESLHSERENAFRQSSRARGVLIPSYIEIDKDELLSFIKKGLTVKKIVEEYSKRGFSIAENTLGHKIEELFGYKFRTLFKILFIYPQIDAKLKESYLFSLMEDGASGDEIQMFYIQTLISKGYNVKEIGELFGVKGSSITYWINKNKTSFEKLRDNYYFKPRFINSFENNVRTVESIADSFPQGIKSILSAISRIWSQELFVFGGDMKKLLRFLIRFYYSYPLIERELDIAILIGIASNNSSPKVIDRKFMCSIMNYDLSKEYLQDRLDFSKKGIDSFIHFLLGYRNFLEFKVECFFRPKIIKAIRNGHYRTEEIGNNISRSPPSVREAIKRIWNTEYIQLGRDYTSLLELLRDRYQ